MTRLSRLLVPGTAMLAMGFEAGLTWCLQAKTILPSHSSGFVAVR